MPDTTDGPAVPTTDTDSSPSADAGPLAGFAEAMEMQFPPRTGAGEPTESKAVETNAAAEEPKGEAEKPADKAEAPATPEAKPPATDTVNFDGLSDDSKAYWEKALKAGHATPADVEIARKESLFAEFQPKWTKRNQEIADRRKAFEAEMSTRKEDLALLDRIRGDEKLHSAWLRMSKGEVAADESGGDLVDVEKAKKVAREEYAAQEAAKTAAQRKSDEIYARREGTIKDAVAEWITALKVEPKVMAGYLQAEEATLKGADPIARFGDDPTELFERVQKRHEIASRDAEIAALKEQVNQRASKTSSQSKQSSPPARRVADPRPSDAWSQAKADLGVSEDFGNVVGFGFGNGARR